MEFLYSNQSEVKSWKLLSPKLDMICAPYGTQPTLWVSQKRRNSAESKDITFKEQFGKSCLIIVPDLLVHIFSYINHLWMYMPGYRVSVELKIFCLTANTCTNWSDDLNQQDVDYLCILGSQINLYQNFSDSLKI